jgi:hypothetical protein
LVCVLSFLTGTSVHKEELTAKAKQYAGGAGRRRGFVQRDRKDTHTFLPEEYDVAISSGSEEDIFSKEDLAFLTGKKKKVEAAAVVTPVKGRFLLEALVDEESTRKRVDAAVRGEEVDSDEVVFDMHKVFGHDKAVEFQRIMDEANRKATDDLDLQWTLHRWSAEGKAAFHARAPARLPQCLAALLGRDEALQLSPDMMRLVLCGDWIPSLFPQRCPAELAQWLFACICFAAEDRVSAAAWDTWTYYFGRRGLWDPDDASFGWFRDGQQQAQRATVDWVPDWSVVVDTFGAFGAPTAPYQRGVAGGGAAPRDDPPRVNRALRQVVADPALLASFPSSQFRRMVSLLGLCFYASASGRLFQGGPVYQSSHASLLLQLALACLVDPLIVSSPKRELTQCIGAALEVFSDDHEAIFGLCGHVTAAAPYDELEPVVSSLLLFSPSTRRAQWLRRCLAFWVASLMLRERVRAQQARPLPDLHRAMFGPGEMLAEMIVFLEALVESLAQTRCKGQEYEWLSRLLSCLDLTLGDRSAITASEEDVTRVSGLLKQVHESFRQGEEMNEFASASRTAIGLMKERIEFNVRFEKNRAESLRINKAAHRIGSGGKQSELSFSPAAK